MLVALVVLSVLVSVLLPMVVAQIERGEPVRVVRDLRAVRTAIELAQVNMRTAYPRSIDDLVFGITETDTDIAGAEYSGAEVSGWKGPYLDAAPPTAGARLSSAFGVEFVNQLVLFNSRTNSVALDPASADFVAIRTTSISGETFEILNDIMDGEGEPDGYGAGLSMATGKLRLLVFPPPLSGTVASGFAYYLAVPYRSD